jgi:hypothetical protein
LPGDPAGTFYFVHAESEYSGSGKKPREEWSAPALCMRREARSTSSIPDRGIILCSVFFSCIQSIIESVRDEVKANIAGTKASKTEYELGAKGKYIF